MKTTLLWGGGGKEGLYLFFITLEWLQGREVSKPLQSVLSLGLTYILASFAQKIQNVQEH